MNILFVGLGNLGSQVFDLFLLRAANEDTFLVAGRNVPYLQQRSSLATYAAMQLGKSPQVRHVYMDVWNIEQTAETIETFKPDVIFTSVTIQPSAAIAKLPRPAYETLARAQPGSWLPLTLALVYKLMQAVQQTGLAIIVLNGAAPDNAHAVLGKVGLAPTSGVGNLANLIPALRQTVAQQLHAPLEEVQVLFFGHNQVAHHLRLNGSPSNVPYYFRALLRHEDVTAQLDLPAVYRTLPNTLKKEYTQLVSAASAAAVFDAVTGKTSNIVHAPGPLGLPGAYPLRMGKQGLEVVLPEGLTLAEAILINQEGQRIDGIERIEQDGTVYFAESTMTILKETLSYECRRMPLADVEERARELHSKYRAFAQQFGQ